MRKSQLALVPLAVGAAAVAAVPISASATSGTLYPSGCNVWPAGLQGGAWQGNCWVGTGYLTGANFVTGVQRFAMAFTTGSIDESKVDGLWGPFSYNRVVIMQSQMGFHNPDGIVGPSTWNAIKDQSLSFMGSYYNFKFWGYSGETIFATDGGSNPSYKWYTTGKPGTGWVHMSTAGPQ